LGKIWRRELILVLEGLISQPLARSMARATKLVTAAREAVAAAMLERGEEEEALAAQVVAVVMVVAVVVDPRGRHQSRS